MIKALPVPYILEMPIFTAPLESIQAELTVIDETFEIELETLKDSLGQKIIYKIMSELPSFMKWDPSENKIVASPNVTDASETEICLKLINV